MKDYFTISSNALPDTTRVAGFRGTEGISRPYEFELYLLAGAEGQDIDLGDAVGVKAKLGAGARGLVEVDPGPEEPEDP